MLFAPPSDGWTTLEQMLLREMILHMYRHLVDPVDRFILMAHYEGGYSQEEIATMVGVSQPAICKRLRDIHTDLDVFKKDARL